MCDHISSSLAKNGAPVYKSMPIGALEDVMPYPGFRNQCKIHRSFILSKYFKTASFFAIFVVQSSNLVFHLARRAQENQTVLAGAHRERKLLWDALMKNK